MAIHPLLAEARRSGNPVIHAGQACLLWQGRTPPLLRDDLGNWETLRPFEKLGAGLWCATFDLPANAYVEYAFIDRQSREHIEDPLNPRRVPNGMGAWNHYFYMPKGKPTPLAQRAPGVPRGTVSRHAVGDPDLLGGKPRPVFLYQPAVKGLLPLLVVYDGSDYLRRARLDVIADTLIARGRVQPFAMALVQNGGRARMMEYACSEGTLLLLLEGVLPLARQHLPLIPPAGGSYGIMGASMGGLMALYTGLRLPHIFGRVLSQSGAFQIPGHDFVTTDLVTHLPRRDLRVWMDVGRFESLLSCNRGMAALLEHQGYTVTCREYSGGHNYTAWRDDLGRGLEALFPPGK